ncbi:MAG: aspartate/glutamate racemase family protein [Candidatus Limnocylindria bacterium]
MTRRQRVVGIIGGMGPLATADLIAKITLHTPVVREQDHLRLLVDSNPAIPDRNDAVWGSGTSPAPALVESARLLERSGAELLVIACNTAHHWVDEVAGAVSIPVISMVDVTVGAAAAHGPARVGVMAITACLATSMYQDRLAAAGIASLTLDDADQDAFTRTIAGIKATGLTDAHRASMARHAGRLVDAGAELLIAGCTEIPIVLGEADLRVPVISSTDELARAAVAAARHAPVTIRQA